MHDQLTLNPLVVSFTLGEGRASDVVTISWLEYGAALAQIKNPRYWDMPMGHRCLDAIRERSIDSTPNRSERGGPPRHFRLSGSRAKLSVVLTILAISLGACQAGPRDLLETGVRSSEYGDSATSFRLWGERSPFNRRIPKDAVYTPEPRIGTVRNTLEEWSMPIYRVSQSAERPRIKVVQRDSGRVEYWPIPRFARPAPEADAHMGVMVQSEGVIYEFWAFEWQTDSSIRAGGLNAFPLNGTGISDPPQYRVTASGFAVSAGMMVREDVLNSATGDLDADFSIDHALAIALHSRLCGKTFVPPAVKPELKCSGEIPMGTLFALPPNADVEDMEIHPLAKAVARALREYGAYVNDGRRGDDYRGKEIAAFRVEPGLLQEMFGQSNNALASIIEKDMYEVIERYGIYRVTKNPKNLRESKGSESIDKSAD